GLATPMSITVALGRGAQAGVLVRDAAALERLAEANVLVLDKTGTLTEGRPVLREIVLTEGAGLDETRLLALAAGIERASEHPLAAAILAAAEARGVAPGEGRAVEAVPGQGIAGEVVLGQQTHRVVLGNAAMLGGVPEALATHAARLQAEGATTVYLAVDGHTAGLIALADPLRPGARETLEALEKTGLRLILATGDAEPTAQAVAAQAGLTEIHAALSPEGKAALVARLQAEGATVAMAGDGINDAPALATADVGLAIGSGADVAVESAAITLTGDLGALVRARRLAKAARANIRQNLAFAFLYNTAGVPVAAGVLYPLFGVLLSPMLAAAAMSLSSLSVIANALRLSRLKL
ncbi:MAG: HAD-IC family P-type ATPase, partial [Pseudomonadota bacterium]